MEVTKKSVFKDEPEIWNLLTMVFDQGERYFSLVNNKILPRISKTELIPIDASLKKEISQLHDAHRKTVDELVLLLRKRIAILQPSL